MSVVGTPKEEAPFDSLADVVVVGDQVRSKQSILDRCVQGDDIVDRGRRPAPFPLEWHIHPTEPIATGFTGPDDGADEVPGPVTQLDQALPVPVNEVSWKKSATASSRSCQPRTSSLTRCALWNR
jgi:hypothetical protein